MLKKTQKKIKILTPTQAAYVAALIDGEGTVTLTRHNRTEYRRLQVGISNTDLDLLKWVKNLVNVGQIILKRTRNKKHAISYTYRVCNQLAISFLIQISPYLKTYKQKRTKLVLKNYTKLTPRNGKYSPKLLAQKRKFIKAFFAIPGSNKEIKNLL